jgi:hypothetical protein
MILHKYKSEGYKIREPHDPLYKYPNPSHQRKLLGIEDYLKGKIEAWS